MDVKFSFFDLDHTLLRVNCSFHFGLYLHRKKLIGIRSICQLFWYYFLHKCGRINIYEIHTKSFESLFRGASKKDFEKYGDSFVEECFERLINYRVLAVLYDAQRRGRRVMILSSSPEFLVKPIARKLGVTDVYSTIYQTNEAGMYHTIEKVLEGKEKAKIVKQILLSENISDQDSAAYSDSHHDLLFLESVSVPIAVNPTKPLLKICRDRGWEVLRLEG
ncbi:MAG: HAD-IB family hydrolase [Chlamydiota bacterium]